MGSGSSRQRGVRRKVDDLGRIVIPVGFRRSLGIDLGDEVEISIDGERVVILKPSERCVFCDASDGLTTFREKAVCWSCAAALRALDRERVGEPAPGYGF